MQWLAIARGISTLYWITARVPIHRRGAPVLHFRIREGGMDGQDNRQQRLVALSLLGLLLFNYPLLALFNVPEAVLGVPVLYAYMFAAWALLIGLMALAVRSRE